MIVLDENLNNWSKIKKLNLNKFNLSKEKYLFINKHKVLNKPLSVYLFNFKYYSFNIINTYLYIKVVAFSDKQENIDFLIISFF